MKKFRLILLLIFILSLVTGCNKTHIEKGNDDMSTTDNKSSETVDVNNTNSKINQPIVYVDYITDIYTDKSAYKPEEQVKVFITVVNPKMNKLEGTIKVLIKHLEQNISEQQREITLNSGEENNIELAFVMPEQDFMGYAVEAYLYENETLIDLEMSAIDVSSDWIVFPRYAYLTNMKERQEKKSREVLDRLLKHHINGLFYYDVIDRHDKPLAGTVEEPDEKWNTLAWRQASQKTVMDMINIGHEYNMNSYVYNLIFGAYDNYEELGIKKEWALYKDTNQKNQDAHNLSGLGWETNKLWLFNPENEGWQDYYLGVHKDLLSVFPYDGIQVDSLGGRGNLYDNEGNPVKLNETYTSLLNRLQEELNTRVIFNPVSGYGMKQLLAEDNYDILYMEVWPGDHDTYSSLKIALDNLYRSTNGERGSVISAYMNYDKSKNTGGSFNTPGVNYTNAVLLAAGGSHLELGDTGMLSSEYYPGDTLKVDVQLKNDLRNYYSFMVAYENVLRGPGLEEIVLKTYVDDKLTSYNNEVGNIWSFTKLKDGNMELVHLINFNTAKHLDWVDNMGTQTEPEEMVNKEVKHYVSIVPTRVSLASPDYQEGILIPLEFETGSDENGNYVTFLMPSLKYWTMVVIQ